MITSDDIDEMEERLLRMCPYVDVTTVNVIRREIKFLRDRIETPCQLCVEKKEIKKEKKKISE